MIKLNIKTAPERISIQKDADKNIVDIEYEVSEDEAYKLVNQIAHKLQQNYHPTIEEPSDAAPYH